MTLACVVFGNRLSDQFFEQRFGTRISKESCPAILRLHFFKEQLSQQFLLRLRALLRLLKRLFQSIDHMLYSLMNSVAQRPSAVMVIIPNHSDIRGILFRKNSHELRVYGAVMPGWAAPGGNVA